MGAIVNIVTNVTQYVTTQPTYFIGGLARIIYLAVVVLKYLSFGMFVVYGIKAMRDRNWMDGIKGAGFVILGLFIAKYGPNIADFIIGNLL